MELERVKAIIKWMISNGIAKNQEGIGKLLGYRSKSSFSNILTGSKPIPAGFLDKLCNLDKKVNKYWIITGTGDMTNPYPAYPLPERTPEWEKRLETVRPFSDFLNNLSESIKLNAVANERNSRNIEKIVDLTLRL